jgi:hypothetical protein
LYPKCSSERRSGARREQREHFGYKAGSLERFNRKERNLLVRAVLGHETKALELSGEFRKTIADALQIAPIPLGAWWATDYHIAWLAGALAVYTEGAEQAVAKGARPNPSANGSSLVKGNQEDIDLVIASGIDLILIEAKGVGAWGNEQLRSKLARLELVRNEYMSSITKTPSALPLVNFHFCSCPPTRQRSSKLNGRIGRVESPNGFHSLFLAIR